MKKEINFGIGFITGRPNICTIINSYYKYMIEQVKDLDVEIKLTCFILYDLNYLNTDENEFYKIDDEVKKYIRIKYLTPKYVKEKVEYVRKKHNLAEEEAELLIGKGYAKARNTILYEAVEDGIDYLLYWDDDEYPLAAVRDGDIIKWSKQTNILQHIKNIENADITYGYRCGMINPLPAVKFNDIITKDVYKQFIDAIENEVISWNKIQYMFKNDSGIGFADKEISEYKKDVEEVPNIGTENFVLGSGICLNLTHLNKIPAFYNPPEARGEDTFFSCTLGKLNAKVLRIPVYHFHDGFLKFTFLMDNKFPRNLKKITTEDEGISLRFKKTTTGWTKYKPLLYYILNKDTYRDVMNEAKIKLSNSVEAMSTAFENCDLTNLPSILEDYDKNVEKHYEEYKRLNEIWDKIKYNIK
ncbi:MAG: hypothetical protein IJH39_08975 [Clostridia bacterium]|nr:hypothetical protein [Clostridia bacterium]